MSHYIIINIIIAILLILLIRIMIYIGTYFKISSYTKEKEGLKFDTEAKISIETLRDSQNNFDANTQNTIAILNVCNSLITIEVAKLLDPVVKLSEKYEYRKLDSDAQLIANNVFEALNKDLIEKSRKFITTEYILKYIASQSITILMDETKKHNLTLV